VLEPSSTRSKHASGTDYVLLSQRDMCQPDVIMVYVMDYVTEYVQ
jgi:hypothetical protein